MDHTGSNRLHGFSGFFKNFRSLTAIVAAFIILLCIYAPVHGAALTQEAKEKTLDAFYSTRVPFLENTGQLGDWNVKYYARALGAGFFITGDGKILYSIARNKGGEGTQLLTISEGFTGVTAFLGNGGQKSTAKATELIGNIPSMWAGGIPSYDWLIFGDISNGISLELAAYGGGLDKFFVVKPQARTGDITVRIEGTQKLSVTANGELAIETAAGVVTFSKPLAYQQVNGELRYVDAAYEIFGDGYGFKVGQYDTTKDLVIVPSLFSMPDAVDGDLPAVEVDNSGSVYIAGSTASLNFTGTGYEGSTDAFIAKLDNTLTSLMALGGTGIDHANAVTTDGKGSVYVAGTTMSPDFPVAGDVYNTTYGGNGDIFISKLDADLLSVVSSSLLGGSGEDRVASIAIDGNGNISIGGLTTSKSFLSPTGTVSGSPNGSLTSFSTTLGANLNSYLSSQSVGTTQKTSGTSSVQKKEETDLTKQADSPVKEGKISGPGWRMAVAQPVGIQEARAYYNAKRAAIAAKKASAPLRLMSSGAEDTTPEIQALARALHNDPKLIYDYVHNNIDYVPYFGSLKGATLTYLDGSGNDCDQASLMIALLRASGYTAWYVYGAAWMWGADLSNWLGVDSTDSAVGNTLALGGIPLDQPFWDGSTWLGRVWVKATINGTTYAFDPALKSYTYVSKIDIGQAMGYSRSTVMTGATSGATVTADYAQNMNETNIRNQLTAYATNMVTTIRSQYPNKEVNEIIGGRNIVRTNLTAYQTEPSFFMYYEIESWQDTVPEEYTTTVTIEHWNQDNAAMDFSHTFKASELGGSRITLTYSQAGSNYYAELRQDGGSPLASSARATTLDAVNHLHISIDHPYAYDQGNYADDYNIDWTVKGGRSYAIAYNFGGVSNKLLQKRQQQLEIYRA